MVGFSPSFAPYHPEFTDIPPPLKQVAQGIPPNEIICKEGLKLVFKSSDNSPACVKPGTLNKLIERGWARTAIIENHEGAPVLEGQKDSIVLPGGEIVDRIPKTNFTNSSTR